MRDLDGVGRRPGSPGSHELMPCCESWLAEQILETPDATVARLKGILKLD